MTRPLITTHAVEQLVWGQVLLTFSDFGLSFKSLNDTSDTSDTSGTGKSWVAIWSDLLAKDLSKPCPIRIGLRKCMHAFAHIKARQIKTHKKCKIVLMSTVNPKLTRKFWVWTNFLEGQQLLCTWQGHPARPSSETARSQGSWWCFRDEDNAQFWPL